MANGNAENKFPTRTAEIPLKNTENKGQHKMET